MIKNISQNPENNQKGSSKIKNKENSGFKLDLYDIRKTFMLYFNEKFKELFSSNIEILETTFKEKRIPLLAILVDINNFNGLYQQVIMDNAKTDKALGDSYQALAVRLQRFPPM